MRTLITSVLFILTNLFFTNPAAAADICTKPKAGQCGFYAQCIESKYKCGADGYPLGYGAKYCDRFSALSPNDLSPKGLVWRDHTLVCLQQRLADLLVTSHNVNTCGDLKTYAFRSHVGCYTQPFAPVCDLAVGDWFTIATVVDLKEYRDSSGRDQVLEVIRKCGPAVKERLVELLKKLKLPVNATDADLMIASSPSGMSEEEYYWTMNEIYELREKLEFINGGIEL